MTDTQLWRRSIKITLCAVVIFLLFCIAFSAALSVTGAKYVGSIAPGGTDTHIMIVEVGAGEPATDIVVTVAGFGQALSGVYSPLDPASDTNPYSARSFITLDNTTLHLTPGTQQSLTATINLPQGTGPGGRYAIIYIRSLPSATSNFQTAVVVPVFITVAGTTPVETGRILHIDTGSVAIGQPITITTTFENTGNYHYYGASNEVTLTDANGAIVANASTAPMAYASIPGNTVQFLTQPSFNTMVPGTYTVDSKVLLRGQVLDENETTLTITTNYIPPPTEANITVSPGSPATLTSPDDRFSVSFPQGAVLSNVVVTLGPYPITQVSPAPAGAKLGATSFEITGLAGLLDKDATVQVTYSADDLAAAGGDASLLKLAYWDVVHDQWVILPTSVNTQDMTLTAGTNQLGICVVMVSSSASTGTPAATATKAPLTSELSLLALVITALIVGGTIGQKK